MADVQLDNGDIVTAYCANTGAMTSCWKPGAPVQLSKTDNPLRKLAWTLERVDMGHGWIGVNTIIVNQFIYSFLCAGNIHGFEKYFIIRREPVYQMAGFTRSRLDLFLQASTGPACFVEIKNATLFDGSQIRFPDAVTRRGKKHLEMLEDAVRKGYRAIILFAVNRPEGNSLRIAQDIDPEYDQTLNRVIQNGVEALALRIVHASSSVSPGEFLPLVIN